jgi:hypothetical protein
VHATAPRLRFETPHRAFDTMPVVVMFDVNYRGVALLLDVPAFGRLLDSQPEDMAAGRELTIDQHRSTSKLGL